jgi:hypothetical protein
MNPRNKPAQKRGGYYRKNENENQFKGFPGATRTKGQTQRVADEGEALLQVEKTV